MEKQFDFNDVGKRMPYTVPEGFFDQLEAEVVARISSGQQLATASGVDGRNGSERQQRARVVKIAVRTMLATAAAAALLVVVGRTVWGPSGSTDDDFDYVELAYGNLSTDDQDFLLELYEDDLLMTLSEEE